MILILMIMLIVNKIIHNAEYTPTIDGSKQIPNFLINSKI